MHVCGTPGGNSKIVRKNTQEPKILGKKKTQENTKFPLKTLGSHQKTWKILEIVYWPEGVNHPICNLFYPTTVLDSSLKSYQ